jgi:SPX domain protein involved in polyphosphate accumulation
VSVESPFYTDRIERKYQVGIDPSDLSAFCRDVSRYAPLHEFIPGRQITWVNSIYFENQEFDLLRFSLLSGQDNIHVRLRTYEYDGSPPRPIPDYWLEMKIKKEEVRKKKRLKMQGEALGAFLEGRDVAGRILEDNLDGADPENIRSSYREIQNTIFNLGLKPTLLVAYRRVAFQNEIERLSIDWDVHYYHVSQHVHRYPSWRDVAKCLGEKTEKIFLELKCPQGAIPTWVANLKRDYPLWELGYFSKYNEGMSFLFPGQFKHLTESNYFLRMIKAYTEAWRHPSERGRVILSI